MAWQRKIPFGYMIQGGIVQPHPQEADAVRAIFNQYLAGASYLTIAEGMAKEGLRYHRHTSVWNKHMVKRILENTKYIGTDGWPSLVSNEDFAAARHQKQERNTYAPLPEHIQPLQSKAVCVCCGCRMIRKTRAHGRVYWRCEDPECGQVVTISDESLAQQVAKRLHDLPQAPHLLTTPVPQRTALTIDAIRLQNELTMALNRGSESVEYIKTLALAAAAQRYGQRPDPTPAHQMDELRERLEQGPATADTLAELLSTAVKAVRLTSSGEIELELINGTIITDEKEGQGI